VDAVTDQIPSDGTQPNGLTLGEFSIGTILICRLILIIGKTFVDATTPEGCLVSLKTEFQKGITFKDQLALKTSAISVDIFGY
jgi:hypothetical protein